MPTTTQQNITRDTKTINSDKIGVNSTFDTAWKPAINRDKTTNKVSNRTRDLPESATPDKKNKEPRPQVLDKSEAIAKRLKIRPATKKAVDLLMANPKMSQTEAWLQTHKTTSPASARATASKVLAKPNIQLYRQAHIDKATRRIVDLVDSKREDIALKASESILDRTYGKSVNKSVSTSINTLEQLLI